MSLCPPVRSLRPTPRSHWHDLGSARLRLCCAGVRRRINGPLRLVSSHGFHMRPAPSVRLFECATRPAAARTWTRAIILIAIMLSKDPCYAHAVVNEAKSVLTQLRKGVLEYCVLALLQHGPSYGIDLAKRLGQHTALFASEGTLYPLLSRLRRQGWVESSWQESTSGPPRRYYQLTDDGRAALSTFATAWELFSQDVRDVLDEEER